MVTLWYRSPELLLQCKYNTSVDVWSAGCIIIELYTREPFIGENTEARQLTAIFQFVFVYPTISLFLNHKNLFNLKEAGNAK